MEEKEEVQEKKEEREETPQRQRKKKGEEFVLLPSLQPLLPLSSSCSIYESLVVPGAVKGIRRVEKKRKVKQPVHLFTSFRAIIHSLAISSYQRIRQLN